MSAFNILMVMLTEMAWNVAWCQVSPDCLG